MTKPQKCDCGYVQADVPPGEIVWTGNVGVCRTCGKQYEYTPEPPDFLVE